jgi:hypothetical protein
MGSFIVARCATLSHCELAKSPKNFDDFVQFHDGQHLSTGTLSEHELTSGKTVDPLDGGPDQVLTIVIR